MRLNISPTLEGLPTIHTNELNDLQGNLKDLTVGNYKRLKASLSDNGFIVPLFVWFDRDGSAYTLDGNQRLRVIKTEIPDGINLPYVEVSAENKQDAKKKILLISSQYGQVTKDGFDEFSVDIDDIEVFIDELTTFAQWVDPVINEDEKKRAIDEIEPAKVDSIEDFDPSRKNQIVCIDCLLALSKMKDNSVDIVVTSPPYNLGGNRHNSADKTGIDTYEDSMSLETYFGFIDKVIRELMRVSTYHVFFNIQEAANSKGIIKYIQDTFAAQLKDTFIWAKTNPSPPLQEHLPAMGFEYIFCFSKDSPDTRVFSYCDFNQREKGKSGVSNTLIYPVAKGFGGHGYTFDQWLPDFFIKNFSKPGALVLDSFMGTGTTAISCIENNRYYIGFEKLPNVAALAQKRVLDYIENGGEHS